MSRAKPRFVDQVPVRTLRFVCSCGSTGHARTLKVIKVPVERTEEECERYVVWGPPNIDPSRNNDLWIFIGQRSDTDVPPDGYVLYLDEPYAPVLYRQDFSSDDPADLLRDGLESVATISENGIRYSYFKLRLRCPHCGLDATFAPEAADQLVRELLKAGVSSVELSTVAKYSGRQ